MARRYGAKVIFLSVVSLPTILEYDEVADMTRLSNDFSRRKKEVQAYLDKCQTAFLDQGITAVGKIAYGPVVNAVLGTAQDVEADIVAMASHGLGGSERTFYGSVTAGVLQRIDRPLLLVRSRRIAG
jgi:nucleotide-binding universal stress UspA family protein